MAYIDLAYAKGFDFPNRDINPSEKGRDYCLNFAKAIYGKYVGNKTAWPYTLRSHWENMRLYAKGMQNTEKYKNWLLADLTDTDSTADDYDDSTANSAIGRRAKREGWYNLLWDVVSPAPKIMNSIHGMFDDVEYDIYVDVIDEKSKDLQENDKWQKIVEGKFADWQNEYKMRAGIPIDENVPLPKSEEEFNMMFAGEGIKLGIAKAMQKLIRTAVDQDGEWSDVIKKKLIDDLLVVGRAATKDYFDAESNKFKPKYVDVVNCIIQYSKEFDFNDSEYAGLFTTWSISNLKKKLPDVSEKEWQAIARRYAGKYGNPEASPPWEGHGAGYNKNTGTFEWDSYRVCVMETEWIDYDTYLALDYKGIRGRRTYHRIGYDTNIKPLSEEQKAKGVEQKVKKVIKRKLYECYWVVGTDHVFDFGPVQMAPLDANYHPTLRTKVESLQQKSLTEQLYPVYDQFELAWLQHQNSMAKMIERGYGVNIGMMMNITDGTGKKWSWNDILTMWKQVGILPYMTSIAGDYRGGQISPVVPIEGGLGKRLEESIKMFEWCFWMIESITGLNPIALGSTPNKDAPVTTTEMSLQATNNSLKPIILALFELKKSTSMNVLRRIQIGLRNDEDIRNSYAGVIGKQDIEAIVMAERDFAQYGLSLAFRPTQVYKDKLREYVKAALAMGRDGKAGIDFNDALFFEERIDQGGDLMDIRQKIAYAVEKNRQRLFAESQANIQAQNQGQMEQKQAQMQADMEMKRLEAELDMMKTQGQLMISRENNNAKLIETMMANRPELLDVVMKAAAKMGDLSKGDLAVVMTQEQNTSLNPLSSVPEARSPSEQGNIPPRGQGV